MRAAVGQRIHTIVRFLQRFEEIEIAVAIVENREIDEALALILHQQIIGIFRRRYARGRRPSGNAFVHARLVIEIGVHLEMDRPAERDDLQKIDDVAFRPDIVFGQHPRLERWIFEARKLLIPWQRGNLFPRRFEAERVDSALPSHDDAIAAQRDLRDDIGTIVILGAHRGNLFLQRHFLGDALQRGESDWQTGFAAQLPHPAEFVPFALHVRRHFEHAIADPAHRPADADQLFLRRGGAGDQFSIDRLVQHGAAGRKTERTRTDALFDDARHFGDVELGRHRTRTLAVTQHIGADRAVRDVRADVDGARQFLQRVEIFRKALPVPAHPLGQRRAGNILDPFHQADQPVVAVGAGGREADPAIAHDDGGNAVPRRWSHFRIPRRLPVIMGVDIDKAGGDDLAAGVDLLPARAAHLADNADAVAIDGDIADIRFAASAIDDGAATDDQIMGCAHGLSPAGSVVMTRTVSQVDVNGKGGARANSPVALSLSKGASQSF